MSTTKYLISVDEDVGSHLSEQICLHRPIANHPRCDLPHMQPTLIDSVVQQILFFFAGEVEVF